MLIGKQPAKGSLRNNFTFYAPMHPAWLRCENSEYPDIPALSRLASRALQRLKIANLFFREPLAYSMCSARSEKFCRKKQPICN